MLFLNEISYFPLSLQSKLLHAVEEKTVNPIGADHSVPVSVKILSATNMDIEVLVHESKFRKDLYYQINTLCLNIPALRDKAEDIMEYMVITSEQECITLDNLPENIYEPKDYPDFQESAAHSLDLATHEHNLLLAALKKCDWNQSQAARELCITRSALRYRLQKYGIKA